MQRQSTNTEDKDLLPKGNWSDTKVVIVAKINYDPKPRCEKLLQE